MALSWPALEAASSNQAEVERPVGFRKAALGELQRKPADEAFLAAWNAESAADGLHLSASSADYYFSSYSHYGVHEEVLKDSATTHAYVHAIRHNKHLFKDKVVLDIGSGLGAFALLAAEAGAQRVIGIESQEELVRMATANARKNGFGSGVVDFLRGTVASVTNLPDGIQHVDILISDFMGYFLFYESRLTDLLQARERWLSPVGKMFPDKAGLHVALLDDAQYRERHFEYFGSVWGFDFSPLKVPAASEPVVSVFQAKQLLSAPQCILDLDLRTCPVSAGSSLAAAFDLRCKRQGQVHGLLGWFDIGFSECHKYVSFTTAPDGDETCWKQTAFFLGSAMPAKASDTVRCMLALKKPYEDHRHLEVKISMNIVGRAGQTRKEYYHWT